MSAPQPFRLVGSKRGSPTVRSAKRQRAEDARLAFEYENTAAALAFLRPRAEDLLFESWAGFEILTHILRRYEDEIAAYVTGD
jgi:hypothetical protein